MANNPKADSPHIWAVKAVLANEKIITMTAKNMLTMEFRITVCDKSENGL